MIHTKRQRTLESLRRIRPKIQLVLSHATLIDALIEEGKSRNWICGYECSHLSRDRTELAAVVYLLSRSGSVKTRFALGIQHSPECRPTIYGGFQMLRDDAGIPLTRIQMSRHNKKFNLKEEAELVFKDFEARRLSFPFTLDRLREQTVSPEQTEKIFCGAGRKGLMPFSRVGRLLKSFQGKNKLDMLLDFARMAKMNPPLQQMRQVHSFLYDCLGI
mgnify:FL=1